VKAVENGRHARHALVSGRNGLGIKINRVVGVPMVELTIKDQHGRAFQSTSRWFPDAGETLTRLPPLTAHAGAASTRFIRLASSGDDPTRLLGKIMRDIRKFPKDKPG